MLELCLKMIWAMLTFGLEHNLVLKGFLAKVFSVPEATVLGVMVLGGDDVPEKVGRLEGSV